MTRTRFAHLSLRLGAAFAFLYPPVRALSEPILWLGYLPSAVRTLPATLGFPIDSLALLHGFGAIEIVLALWMLSGWRIRVPAALATFLLLAIVAFNWADMDVLFRDLSLAMMTLALVFWPEPKPAGILRQ